MPRTAWTRLLPLFVVLACVDTPLGPGNEPPVQVRVLVTLPAATPPVWYPRGDTLRVSVRRAGRTDPIVDSAGVIGDSLAALLLVSLSQAVDHFVVTAEVHVGGQVLFLAFDAIELRAGVDTAVTLNALYVGPGSAAKSYTLQLRDSTLHRGDTTSLVPLVKDSLGQVLNNVPARYLSLRPTLVTVSATGLVTAQHGVLDTGRLEGFLPVGLSSATLARLVAKVGFLDKVSGDSQVGSPLLPLSQALAVRVRDDGGLPLGGATVTFAADSGDGSFSLLSAISDSNGRASATWTLGAPVGVQGATAAVAGVPAVRFTATAQGVAIPDTNPVVFVSTRDGHRVVYVMNADGSGARRVTQSPNDDYYPAWSPDRNQIAFERLVPTGTREIFVVNRDGTNERQLTFNSIASGRPRFSPDGSKIAFNSSRNEANEVWVMGADGSNQHRLLDPQGGHDFFGDWSPDGAQIVFLREGTAATSFSVYTADSTGADTAVNDQVSGAAFPNVCSCRFSALAARWSPLGGQITVTGAVYGLVDLRAAATRNSRGTTLAHAPARGPTLARVVAINDTLLITSTLASGFGFPPQPPPPLAFAGNLAYAQGEGRFVLESDAAGSHQIYAGDSSGALTRLSPAGVAEYEPDYAPAALPFYVARVVITPGSATLVSDGPSASFSVQAFDAQNRPATVPIQWADTDPVIALRPDTPAVAYAIAVGTGTVSASFNGWRGDTVRIPVTSGLGPDPQRFVIAFTDTLIAIRGDGSAADTIALPSGMYASYPAYSPDGSLIAFSATVGNNYDGDIYVINANGTGLRKVTSVAADHTQPSWSPDGLQIVFMGNTAHGYGGLSHIWVVNADGTGEHSLTVGFGYEEADPAWSPDGSLILYAEFFSNGSFEIDGLGIVDQSRIAFVSSARYPAWAPDATSFVFTVGNFTGGLARMALPSRVVTPLAGTPPSPPGSTLSYDAWPSVASDGRVVFQQGRQIPFYSGPSQWCVVRGDASAQACITNAYGQGASWRLSTPPNYVAHLLIGGDLATPLPIGSTRQLSASATDQHGAPITPVGGYLWYPLDPSLATVDSTGLVTAVASGTPRFLLETGLAVPDTAQITVP